MSEAQAKAYKQWIDAYVGRTPFLAGTCSQAVREMSEAFPELRKARGYAEMQDWTCRALVDVLPRHIIRAHWWLVTEDGAIVDPTAAQYRFGIADYREWRPGASGIVGRCMQCGADIWRPVIDPENVLREVICGDACAKAFDQSQEQGQQPMNETHKPNDPEAEVEDHEWDASRFAGLADAYGQILKDLDRVETALKEAREVIKAEGMERFVKTEDEADPAPVTRPAHYGGEANPFEPIKIIEHYGLGFHAGNTIKYILRAKQKGSYGDDLRKAAWYLQREIEGFGDRAKAAARHAQLLSERVIDGGSASTAIIADEQDLQCGGASHEYVLLYGSGSGEVVIKFQRGPVKEFGVNGVQHDALLSVLIDRLECFQASKFACSENEAMLAHLKAARAVDRARTLAREQRGVEGTNVK